MSTNSTDKNIRTCYQVLCTRLSRTMTLNTNINKNKNIAVPLLSVEPPVLFCAQSDMKRWLN